MEKIEDLNIKIRNLEEKNDYLSIIIKHKNKEDEEKLNKEEEEEVGELRANEATDSKGCSSGGSGSRKEAKISSSSDNNGNINDDQNLLETEATVISAHTSNNSTQQNSTKVEFDELSEIQVMICKILN